MFRCGSGSPADRWSGWGVRDVLWSRRWHRLRQGRGAVPYLPRGCSADGSGIGAGLRRVCWAEVAMVAPPAGITRWRSCGRATARVAAGGRVGWISRARVLLVAQNPEGRRVRSGPEMVDARRRPGRVAGVRVLGSGLPRRSYIQRTGRGMVAAPPWRSGVWWRAGFYGEATMAPTRRRRRGARRRRGGGWRRGGGTGRRW